MRKLNIKYFLGNNPNPVHANSHSSGIIDSGLKDKSLFNPLNAAKLEVFKGLVLHDLDRLTPKKNVNIRHMQEGIEMLEKRKEIIKKQPGKGGLVILL